MTVSERNKRIAALKRRKDAIVWKFIGACNEINDQIDELRMTEVEHEPDKKTEATV